MKLTKIINEITFTSLKESSLDEVKKIREIRNEVKIRKNMINSKIISYKDHLKWCYEISNSKINFFYIIRYKNQIIGGLGLKNYNDKLKLAEWSFYVCPKKNFIGLGATLEFKAIDYLFEKFELKKLYCYVLGHNLDVIKLHIKFGFDQITFEEYTLKTFLEKNIAEAIYFSLDRFKWKKLRKLIYKKYF